MGLQNGLAKTKELSPFQKRLSLTRRSPRKILSLIIWTFLLMSNTFLGLKEHPSALSSFQEMMDAAKGKWVVVFLDYDGTLSPIVNDPERAFMSDLAVGDVAKLYPTAIISGRSRQKGNELTVFQPAQDFLPSIEKMLNELEETTSEMGSSAEDNRFCISDFGLLKRKQVTMLAPWFSSYKGWPDGGANVDFVK
ncbi:hypothetical protein HAX54_025755 [Datura stramonium]|uniref:Uncharacterized protein n=1 Tax=Datura stramonium TaxID=4076 RepID=A0ABS8V239_DATST|nr:hypothetical protein [Datura stramonium]